MTLLVLMSMYIQPGKWYRMLNVREFRRRRRELWELIELHRGVPDGK